MNILIMLHHDMINKMRYVMLLMYGCDIVNALKLHEIGGARPGI